MKTLFIYSLFLFAFATTSVAQFSTKQVESIKKNLIQSFQKSNSEVVESSLITTIQLAKEIGIEELSEVKKEIALLSGSTSNPNLRMKAWLTIEALSSQIIIDGIPKYDVSEQDSVFTFINSSLKWYAFKL